MDIFKTDGGNVKISMSFLGANNGIVTGSGTLIKVTRGEDVIIGADVLSKTVDLLQKIRNESDEQVGAEGHGVTERA